MFTLQYVENGEQRRHVLSAGDTIVGRGASCGVVLDDPSVSRAHARFHVSGDNCVVVDLASRNGVYHNGELVSDAVLTDGDEVRLGQFPLTIRQARRDPFELSEDHALLNVGQTIYRPIGRPAAPPAEAEATRLVPSEAARFDAARLLPVFSEMLRALARSHALLDVLSRVVQVTFDNVSAERAFVVLADDRTGDLVPQIAMSRQGPMPKSGISGTIVRTVMKQQVAMLAADARVDPRLSGAESIAAQEIRSVMCAPLWRENGVIGVIYVDNPRSRAFSAADLDLFSTLSNYAAVAIEQARLTASVLEQTRRRERLEQYHSPAVVSRIMEATEQRGVIAQERDVTVMFLDIVGFTTLAEQMGPAQVALTLNAFFARMTEVLFAHEGTLDKFIGDAIFAVFGAPLDQPDHPLRAVRCALGMREALCALNAEARGPQLQMRIAISTGVGMVGDIGSPRRREFTVLGDVVNTASRVESSVAGPGQIVITGSTWEKVRDQIEVRPLGSVMLRGKTGGTDVFEVIGLRATEARNQL